jgi:hypothetical protein
MEKEAIDAAVERSLIQNALGYSFDSEKVFQTGVRMNVVEHVPPNVRAQEIWLRNRMPDVYREKKQHDHILGIEDGLRACLERMSEQSKLVRAQRAARKQLIDRTSAADAEVV